MEIHNPNQQIFLSNECNKCQFISLLNQHLEAEGKFFMHTGDADTLMVAHALRYAWTLVNVVTDDTNVLVF